MLFAGSATTSLMRDPTNGRAIEAGTGVTSPTQRLESAGERTGTGMMMRLRNPATLAKVFIISA